MLNSKLKIQTSKIYLFSSVFFISALSAVWLNSNNAGHFINIFIRQDQQDRTAFGRRSSNNNVCVCLCVSVAKTVGLYLFNPVDHLNPVEFSMINNSMKIRLAEIARNLITLPTHVGITETLAKEIATKVAAMC